MLRLHKPLLPEWRWWPALALAALITTAGVAVVLSPSPPRPQQRQIAQTETHNEVWDAVREAFDSFRTVPADNWIACFTALTTLIFLGQLFAMRRANQHFRVTERAYVKLSHESPGILWQGNSGKFRVSLRITNFGRTPARVTDVVTNFFLCDPTMKIDELPPSVQHGFSKETKAFLVTQDYFFQHIEMSITPTEQQQVVNAAQKLIFYGYADYVDQFGVRHRSGYGRQYEPRITQNNLIFPDEGLFNYDRKRARGEGRDWD